MNRRAFAAASVLPWVVPAILEARPAPAFAVSELAPPPDLQRHLKGHRSRRQQDKVRPKGWTYSLKVDRSGVLEVWINGKVATLSDNGHFEVSLPFYSSREQLVHVAVAGHQVWVGVVIFV